MLTTKHRHEAIDGDADEAPGEVPSEVYRATTGRQGAPALYLWFVTADPARQMIYPVTDIRTIAPPDNAEDGVAFIHFSGDSVALTGSLVQRVVNRITIQRCTPRFPRP